MAASNDTTIARCAIQIVPLIHVGAMIERAVETPAAAQRAYVSDVDEGPIVVGLIGTAADRGARGQRCSAWRRTVSRAIQGGVRVTSG